MFFHKDKNSKIIFGISFMMNILKLGLVAQAYNPISLGIQG